MKKMFLLLCLLSSLSFADTLTLNCAGASGDCGGVNNASFSVNLTQTGAHTYTAAYTIVFASNFGIGSPAYTNVNNIFLPTISFKVTTGGFNNVNPASIPVNGTGTYLKNVVPSGFVVGSDGTEVGMQVNKSGGTLDCGGGNNSTGWICVDTTSPGFKIGNITPDGSGNRTITFNFNLDLTGAVIAAPGQWSLKAGFNYNPKRNGGYDTTIVSINGDAPPHTTVPEPASLALFGSGLLGVGGFFRKKLIA